MEKQERMKQLLFYLLLLTTTFTYAQVQNELWLKQHTASGTDTYTATISGAGYNTGRTYKVKFTNANTGAATININSLGAKSIKKNATEDLVTGDIKAGGEYLLSYDGTNFQLIGGTSTTGVGLTDGDKGDITVSASGATWTIDNNTISTAKLQNLSVTDAKVNDVAWGKITGTPTSLSGYGIIDAWKTSGTSTLTSEVTIAQAGFNNLFLNGNSLFGPTGATITSATRADIRGVAGGNVWRAANDANTTLGAFQNDGIFYVSTTPISGSTYKIQTSGNVNTTYGAFHAENLSTGAAAYTRIQLSNSAQNGQIILNGSGNTNLAGANSLNLSTSSTTSNIGFAPNSAIRYQMSTFTHTWSQQAGTAGGQTFLSYTQGAQTGGIQTGLLYTGGAHTTLSATEHHDWNINLNRTVQFTGSTGFATQRAIRIQAPTYSFVSATGTITNASTVSISGAPSAGTNAVITNPWALNIESGNIGIQSGNLVFGTSGSFIGENGGDATTIDFGFTNNEIGIQGDGQNYISIQGASVDNIIYQSDSHSFKNGTGISTASISSVALFTLGSSSISGDREFVWNSSTANSNLKIGPLSGTGKVKTVTGLVVGDIISGGDGTIDVEYEDDNNTVLNLLTLISYRGSGTGFAAGLGTSFSFKSETSGGNVETGAIIEAVTTDVTSTSEDFDLDFKTMTGGAAATSKMKIKSDGQISTSLGTLVYTNEVTISSGQVLSGNSSPVTIVPAPGSGYRVAPIAFHVFLDYNSSAYATNTDFRFEINGAEVSITNTTLLTSTADTWRDMGLANTDITSTVDNQALVFKVQTGNPTAGNSPIRVRCIYAIVPVN